MNGLNILNQYKDRCKAINNKILRPIVFKDVQEIYTLLSGMLSNNKDLTLFRYNDIGLYSAQSIESISIAYNCCVRIGLCNLNMSFIDEIPNCIFHVNADHSIFVIINICIPGIVWIIKDR